jgi:hypothetical protein
MPFMHAQPPLTGVPIFKKKNVVGILPLISGQVCDRLAELELVTTSTLYCVDPSQVGIITLGKEGTGQGEHIIYVIATPLDCCKI